MIYLFVLI